MTPVQRALIRSSLVWAIAGAALALSALPQVNADARWLVAVASVAFPATAVLAALALRHGAVRWAGTLLLVSAATPTYSAWALNLPALVAGLVLMTVPSVAAGRGPVPEPTR
jgi:hypothetical protein